VSLVHRHNAGGRLAYSKPAPVVFWRRRLQWFPCGTIAGRPKPVLLDIFWRPRARCVKRNRRIRQQGLCIRHVLFSLPDTKTSTDSASFWWWKVRCGSTRRGSNWTPQLPIILGRNDAILPEERPDVNWSTKNCKALAASSRQAPLRPGYPTPLFRGRGSQRRLRCPQTHRRCVRLIETQLVPDSNSG